MTPLTRSYETAVESAFPATSRTGRGRDLSGTPRSCSRRRGFTGISTVDVAASGAGTLQTERHVDRQRGDTTNCPVGNAPLPDHRRLHRPVRRACHSVTLDGPTVTIANAVHVRQPPVRTAAVVLAERRQPGRHAHDVLLPARVTRQRRSWCATRPAPWCAPWSRRTREPRARATCTRRATGPAGTVTTTPTRSVPGRQLHDLDPRGRQRRGAPTISSFRPRSTHEFRERSRFRLPARPQRRRVVPIHADAGFPASAVCRSTASRPRATSSPITRGAARARRTAAATGRGICSRTWTWTDSYGTAHSWRSPAGVSVTVSHDNSTPPLIACRGMRAPCVLAERRRTGGRAAQRYCLSQDAIVDAVVRNSGNTVVRTLLSHEHGRCPAAASPRGTRPSRGTARTAAVRSSPTGTTRSCCTPSPTGTAPPPTSRSRRRSTRAPRATSTAVRRPVAPGAHRHHDVADARLQRRRLRDRVLLERVRHDPQRLARRHLAHDRSRRQVEPWTDRLHWSVTYTDGLDADHVWTGPPVSVTIGEGPALDATATPNSGNAPLSTT